MHRSRVLTFFPRTIFSILLLQKKTKVTRSGYRIGTEMRHIWDKIGTELNPFDRQPNRYLSRKSLKFNEFIRYAGPGAKKKEIVAICFF